MCGRLELPDFREDEIADALGRHAELQDGLLGVLDDLRQFVGDETRADVDLHLRERAVLLREDTACGIHGGDVHLLKGGLVYVDAGLLLQVGHAEAEQDRPDRAKGREQIGLEEDVERASRPLKKAGF